MEDTQEPPSGGRGTDPDELSSHAWEEGGWDLWLGPGARLDRLGAVIEALSERETGPARLADLEDLALLEAPERGRLVLDQDLLPREDLGYLRRFLERTPGFELVLVGDGAGPRGLRHAARRLAWPPDLDELEELCAPPRDLPARADRGHAAPPRATHGAVVRTVETVPAHEEVEPDGPEEPDLQRGPDDHRAERDDEDDRHRAPSARRAPPPPAWSASGPSRGLGADEARELAAIQAVLDLPPVPDDLEPEDGPAFDAGDHDPFGALQDVPTLDDEEDADDDAPDASELDPFARPLAREAARPREPSSAARAAPVERAARDVLHAPPPRPDARLASQVAPPAYYRAQIADLADIAQRVDLALRALRPAPDRAAPPDDGYEPLAGEVARLLQFTRTLSYLVAPPPRGAQTFDLGVLVEEVLDQTVELGPDAPRCVFRRADGLAVRSDKGLLVQALDAFFVLALACAGPGELIRVQVRAVRDAVPRPAARLSIEFPSGPLADLAPERVAEPYALKTRLPSFGPNALSAASGIVAGQGGAVRLAALGDGRLELAVDLPLA